MLAALAIGGALIYSVGLTDAGQRAGLSPAAGLALCVIAWCGWVAG